LDFVLSSQNQFAISKDDFLLQVFFVFAIFVFRETRFFRNIGSFGPAKLVPHFRETRKSFRSQLREIFAKRNFVKNPISHWRYETRSASPKDQARGLQPLIICTVTVVFFFRQC
jgi:hypothetical protein